MFDPLTQAYLTKAVSHGVTSFISIACKEAATQSSKAIFAKVFEEKNHFSTKSMNPLEQALFAINPTEGEKKDLHNFLRSEIFASLLRAFTAISQASTKTSALSTSALTPYLKAIFSDREHRLVEPLSAEIVSLCELIIADSWNTAIAAELIPNDWHIEQTTQAVIDDEIGSLGNQASRNAEISLLTLREFDNFFVRYRRQVSQRNSKLRPQSIHEAVEIPIDTLYITPSLVGRNDKPDRILSREDVLNGAYRIVLLGNPGGGKSTFAAKLCFDLATRFNERNYGGRQLTPVLITLREFAKYKKDRPCSILDFILLQAHTEYQLPDVPHDGFLIALLNGSLLVIFDGLDELIDTQDRVAIKNAVEHFATEYPSTPILVTSREVGYEQAPLDRTKFSLFKLAAFDESQTSEYVAKWFNITRQGGEEEKKRLTESFLRESAVVPDLVTNPLMLGLLCNLYRQDGYLPNNRPEVYLRCAELLFTKWDRHRGIAVQLPMDRKLRAAMCHLANWIYSNQLLQDGVTERQLISETTKYLSSWKEEPEEAEAVATQFVEFFKGRAWVFSDTGSDKSQSLYQFTHRTFLEYFTAEHLVKTLPNAVDLHKHLLPHVAEREWDVVCQLAYQMNAQAANSHDMLVNQLLEGVNDQTLLPNKLAVLSFCARSLDLIYPTPQVRRRAVAICTSFLLENASQITASNFRLSEMALAIARAVLGTSDDNRKIHETEITRIIQERIQDKELDHSLRADALLLMEQLPLICGERAPNPWHDIANTTMEENRSFLAEVALKELAAAPLAWWRQYLDASELIRAHGPDVVFQKTAFPIGGWLRISIAENIFRSLLLNGNLAPGTAIDKWITAQAPQILEGLVAAMPLLEPINLFADPLLEDGNRKLRNSWPSDQASCALSIIMSIIIIEQGRTSTNIDAKQIRNPFRRDLMIIAYSRLQRSLRTAAMRITEERCAERERNLIHAWMNNRFMFVNRSS